ncbi:MAG: nucleotidyltransferase family protein [Fusicatenibacter sp.]|nr:nucleotidyltransferase family protein [Fusicatenibacter sp.]
MKKNNMTPMQQILLEVIKEAVRGRAFDREREEADQIDWTELHRLAVIHHISAFIYDTVGRQMRQSGKNPQEAALWRQEAMREVFVQMQTTANFLATYRKLSAAGVKALVVKGVICRETYPKPDYRVSSDEDVLIRKEDFEKCDCVLRELGYQREQLTEDPLPYEVSYHHPQMGVSLELHLSFFAEESGAYGHLNREFDQVFEHATCQVIENTPVYTPDPTDHYFYLICHSFKHFLHSGFGIRQVCDMMMFQEQYGREIRWDEILEKLDRLHMKIFWANLISIMQEDLGADLEKAQIPSCREIEEADRESLLLDLMNGGIYGDSSMERKHSSNITLQAAAAGKKDTIGSFRASLFPDRSYMKGKYPWLNQKPWLLPAAWVMRIASYAKNRKKQSNENTERNSAELGLERVELLKKYGIIK